MQYGPFIVMFFLAFVCAGSTFAKDVSDASLDEQAKVFADREALKQKFEAHSPQARLQNEQLAAKAAKRANSFFKRGLYKKARFYYLKSIQHNPTVDLTYYEYAVSLYKLDENRKASYILTMLESGNIDQTELHYYQGLVHYKLKENEIALKKFESVRDEKDAKLSPLAAMYAGIIGAGNKDYSAAKSNFEFVLDNSKDPALDKRAEGYIESILRTEKFEETAKQKWAYAFFTGAGYDGNVLNAANTNAASDNAAYRLIYGASVNYKALYTLKHTLVPQLWVSDMYSVDKKFKSDSSIQSADPLQAEFSVPYKRYLKSGTITISPAYQVLYMSINEDGRELIFNTAVITTAFSTSHFDRWITEYRLDFAKDTAHLEITNPADDQSAMKYTALLSNTRLLDGEGYKSLTFDLMYTKSDTEGANFRYTRYLGALGAGFPLSKSRKLLGYFRVDYFSMDFSESSTSRKDDGIIATLGSNYSLNGKSSLSFNLQYYDNSSNVALFDYDKFVVTAIYTFSSGFF